MDSFDSLVSRTWLGDLDETLVEALKRRLRRVRIAAGDVLFRQDDAGDSMYLVTGGRLEVLMRDPEGGEWLVQVLEEGDFAGEMALMTGQSRVATVQAVEPAELQRLDKADFDELSDAYPQILTRFGEYVGPKLQRTQLVGVLSRLFGAMDMKALHKLEQRLVWRHLSTDEMISLPAEPPGSMYIVVTGRIRVGAVDPDDRLRVLGELGRGQTIGEFNLLTGENHRVVLTAVRETDLVRISQDAIESLLREHPESVLRFARGTAVRMQAPSRSARREGVPAASFALVPISEGTPLSECASLLGGALEAFGPTLHLSSELFEHRYGKAGAAQTREEDPMNIPIASWMTHQEQVHTYVLYECDVEWNSWTRRCLRQADRILLVGSAGSSPSQGRLELAIEEQGHSTEQELIILHPDSTELPSGTMAWLSPRTLKAHHHVRRSNAEDFRRLSRRLIGKEVALVLSGGGARGFAHAGVYKALIEAGIPVDLIGGTSMGALIAGSLAQGDDYEGVMAFADQYGSPETLYDFTIPAVSFLASHKVTRMVTGIFQERRIEDLWRPFFCVSADLTEAQPIVHKEGPLWQAVRGSLAIPGIFSPLMIDGDVIVDGGVMNNFPIDLMRNAAPTGWVIGVNVSPPREIGHDYNFEPGLSGWRVILSRLNPFSRKLRVPSIFSILTRSVEVRGIYQMALVGDKADTLIRPNVEEWNYLDFRPARAIAEAGYEAANEIIDSLKAELSAEGFQSY